MKYIVGLGNPEPEYKHTRHNIGKDFLDILSSQNGYTDWKLNKYINCDTCEFDGIVRLLKPLNYMNSVGECVAKAAKFFDIKTEDLLIAYDDLDLVAGEYKFAYAKGSRIHNGIISIKDHLNSEDFWHLRIGVRDESISMSVQKSGVDPAKYVLSKPSTTDSNKISEALENVVIPDINAWLSKNR